MRYLESRQYMGRLNNSKIIRRNLKLPHSVGVKDITLREGFGSGLLGLGVEKMARIAEKLDEMNLPVIQVEFRGYSDEVKRNFKIIKDHVRKAKLDIINLAFSDQWKETTDAAAEVGVDSVCLSLWCNELEMRHSIISETKVLERIVEVIQYSKDVGLETYFHIADAPRTDLEFMKKLCKVCIEAKVDGAGISDSWGIASPATWKYLVSEVKKATPGIPFSIHCHNDFGQALANTLAGIEAGADNVDVCINGYGERSGMPALDEVVGALTMLYGLKFDIRLDKMVELYRLFEELTGTPIAANKPLVGKYAFSYHYDSRFTYYHIDPLLILPFNPNIVGNGPTILLTRYSGSLVLKEKLRELGLELLPDKIPQFLERARQQLVQQERPFLQDDEIRALVEQVSQGS